MALRTPLVRRSVAPRDLLQNNESLADLIALLGDIPILDGEFIEGIKVNSRHELIIPHRLERPYRGVICTSHPGSLVVNRSAKDKDKRIVLRVSSQWTLISEQTTADDVTAVTFDNLDGDVDEAYKFEIIWDTETSTSASLQLRPNGAAPASQEASFFTVAGGTYIDNTAANLRIGFSSDNDQTMYVEGEFWAARNSANTRERLCRSRQEGYDGTNTIMRQFSGRWSDTSTLVRSIDFTCGVANEIRDGSQFRLYKRGLNGETVDVWVF